MVSAGNRARLRSAVRQLTTRFSKASSLGHVAIATLPTPAERLVHASGSTGAEVWCKRDDLTAPRYGGNKVRKLEWLLGDARDRGCDCIVTTGALGSHHVLATSLYGAEQGFEVHAVVFPQPWTDHVDENLRADLRAGATLYPAKSYAGVAARLASVAARLRMKGRRPYVVGPGGSSPVGALGYLEAGLELSAQIDAGELPEPEAIYIAAGSGGCAAGVAVGLAAAGLTIPVVTVRVTHRVAINRPLLGQLVRRTVGLVRNRDPQFPSVTREALRLLRVESHHLGDGYGVATEAGERATRLAGRDGLPLDPTYTAKAFAALVADAERDAVRRPLFWQTLSSADVAPLIADAPPAPRWARELAAVAG